MSEHSKESRASATEEDFDVEDIRYYRSLSAKDKLDYLEQMNLFLLKITPESAKKMNQILKKEGY